MNIPETRGRKRNKRWIKISSSQNPFEFNSSPIIIYIIIFGIEKQTPNSTASLLKSGAMSAIEREISCACVGELSCGNNGSPGWCCLCVGSARKAKLQSEGSTTPSNFTITNQWPGLGTSFPVFKDSTLSSLYSPLLPLSIIIISTTPPWFQGSRGSTANRITRKQEAEQG